MPLTAETVKAELAGEISNIKFFAQRDGLTFEQAAFEQFVSEVSADSRLHGDTYKAQDIRSAAAGFFTHNKRYPNADELVNEVARITHTEPPPKVVPFRPEGNVHTTARLSHKKDPVPKPSPKKGSWLERLDDGHLSKGLAAVTAGLLTFGAIESATHIMGRDERGETKVNMSPLLWTLGYGVLAAGTAYLAFRNPHMAAEAAR